MLRALIDTLRSDGSITINKKLIKEIGILEAALYSELLSRYCYFAERGQLTEDGYFFNTVVDLEEATGLSGYQQRGIIKKLVALGLILTETRGIPPVRYFKITDKITTILMNSISKETALLNVKKLNLYSEETALLKVKKLDTNNTNIIIQNNNDNIINNIKDFTEVKSKANEINSNNILEDTGKDIILENKDIKVLENNNNENIKVIENRDIEKKVKRTARVKEFVEMKQMIEDYTENEKVKERLREYYEIRVKKGLKKVQLQIILDDLRKYSVSATEAIEKINTATAGGYMQIIPSWEKTKANQSYSKPHFDNTINHEVSTAVVSMSKEEREEFDKNLHVDEDGKLIEF